MKTLLLQILYIALCFSISEVQAQNPSDSTPSNCFWDLHDSIFTQIGRTEPISYAKTQFPANFKDVSYDKDGTVGNCNPVDSCVDEATSLIYEVFYPADHNYNATNAKLPVMILWHGGGFGECPKYTQALMRNLCSAFAYRGFVTINAEYRRGRLKDKRNDAYTSAQHLLAAARSLQDGRGLIRSVIKRERLHDSLFATDPYRIDTNRIFIGGVSAGGLMAVTLAWFSNPMIAQSFPTPYGLNTMQDVLGSIDADYYFGEPTITYKPRIKGVVSLWGAVAIPYEYRAMDREDSFFIQQNYPATLKPVISFHGARDSTFPYYQNSFQNVIFSPPPDTTHQLNYNSEHRCLLDTPFVIDGDLTTLPELISASSLNIYKIGKGIDSTLQMELYVDKQMGHGLDTAIGANFKSDFGTGYDNGDAVTIYIVQKAATFLQAVMNNKSAHDIGPPSKFVDCANFRKKCDSPDNNNCNDTDSD